MDYFTRIARVLDARDNSDVALATWNPLHVEYLTGLQSSNIGLLLSDGVRLIVTDGRYSEAAQEFCSTYSFQTTIDRDVQAACRAEADRRSLSVQICDGSPVDDPIMRSRMSKDADELAALERAAAVTSRAFEEVPQWLRVGMTEIAAARHLESRFVAFGADDRAFPAIVAFGAHTSRPHHVPGDRILCEGDAVMIDAGARIQGYCADMTRMFSVGTPPEWLPTLHEHVNNAAAAARAAVHKGEEWSELDHAAREVFGRHGLTTAFLHGLGHGIGLAVHEPPILRESTVGSIALRTTFTVEPGAYLPGVGGVRIEDTCVVEPYGARVLTDAPRSVVEIDGRL